MRHFDDILAEAADRKGGEAAIWEGATPPKSADEVALIPPDAFLASFAEGIFQTGLAWTVVKNKWPGILEAFHGFDVGRVAMMSDDWFYDLVEDKFGQFVADWPREDFAGLVLWMKKNGSRLGGSTGAYALRRLGVDSFLLSRDVVARLIAEGVIDKPPTSQKAMQAVQEAFNIWMDQSERGLTEVSRVLAQSIDA